MGSGSSRQLAVRCNDAGDPKPNGRSHADRRLVDYSSSPNTADVNIGKGSVQTMRYGRAKDGKLKNLKER